MATNGAVRAIKSSENPNASSFVSGLLNTHTTTERQSKIIQKINPILSANPPRRRALKNPGKKA